MPRDVSTCLKANWERVTERIEHALERAGRTSGSTRVVAVTKSVEPEVALRLFALGVTDLGESRVQELERKRAVFDAAGRRPRWHMIGHLQTNKIAPVARACVLIHSVDRVGLYEKLRERAHHETVPEILLQVNISGESSKHGFRPEDVESCLERLAADAALMCRGLMTMAPYEDDPERTRPVFAALRDLSDRLRGRGLPLGEELSMGMSHDYEIAVAEGATLVRIGSNLFEGME